MGANLQNGHFLSGVTGGAQWATGQAISAGDVVWKDGYPIRCLVGHTSGTYATDVQSGYWALAYNSKNHVINSNFDNWQRGASFSNSAGSPYTADRWWLHSASSNTTVSQVTTSLDAGMKYACSLKFTSASSSSYLFVHPFEDTSVIALQGKQISVSFRYKNVLNASNTCKFSMYYSTTANQKDPVTNLVPNTDIPNSASWATFQFTTTVPANALSLTIYVTNSTNTVNNAELQFGKVMLNEGPAPAPFQTAGANITEELQMCQWFYKKHSIGNGLYGSVVGMVQSSGSAWFNIPGQMRRVPTITYSTFLQLAQGNTSATITSTNVNALHGDGITLNLVTGLGFTSGFACMFYANGGAASLELDAEL